MFRSFVFVHPLLERTPWGVFIYAFLGQAEQSETNMDDIGGSRTKRTWVARLRQGPVPPSIVWASWPPSLTSCALDSSRDKTLTPEESQVNLSLGRFLKCQNTQNSPAKL
jgi:hypothetical protein